MDNSELELQSLISQAQKDFRELGFSEYLARLIAAHMKNAFEAGEILAMNDHIKDLQENNEWFKERFDNCNDCDDDEEDEEDGKSIVDIPSEFKRAFGE